MGGSSARQPTYGPSGPRMSTQNSIEQAACAMKERQPSLDDIAQGAGKGSGHAEPFRQRGGGGKGSFSHGLFY